MPLPHHLELSGLPVGARVVLVHGLWFRQWALIPLARGLAGAGFQPVRFGWHTVADGFEDSAARLARFVAALEAPRVDFVAHSLGGLLVRALLHAHPELPPGRVVTLGSPHGGTRTGRQAARVPLLRRLLGRAVGELIDGVPETWRPPGRPFGVVAGTRSLGLGRLFPGLERPNDGVVSLAEARLPFATAFRAVPVSHSGLVFSADVARLVAAFLEGGAFPD